MTITFIAGISKAKETCHTLPECQKLKLQIDAKIQKLQGGFIRNGKIERVGNQDDATGVCERQSKRLPTARELAIEATLFGAEILETYEVPSGEAPRGFYLVSVINPDNKRDQFYFNRLNFKWPTNIPLSRPWIWSSSLDPNDNENAFGLNSENGYIYGEFFNGHTNNGDSAVCLDP